MSSEDDKMVNRIKKGINVTLFSIFTLMIGNINVLAIEEGDCEKYFGHDFLALLKELYGTICLIIIVALIIFGILDFIQGLAGDKDDSLKKSASKFMKRTAIAMVIIILPVLIDFALGIFWPGLASCINGF